MGELFSLSFYKDIPWVLAAGGSKGELAVWDTEEQEKVATHFTPFLDKSKVTEQFDDEDPEEADADDMEDSEEEEKQSKKKEKAKKVKKNKDKFEQISKGI